MKILTFDQSKFSGWAAGDTTRGPFAWGSFELFESKRAKRLRLFRWNAERLINEHRPDAIVYEEPITTRYDKVNIMVFTYSLIGILEVVALDHGIDCYYAPARKWRKEFLRAPILPKGRDRLKKAAIEQCKIRGYTVENDNEAEAIGICEYSLCQADDAYSKGALPLMQATQ